MELPLTPSIVDRLFSPRFTPDARNGALWPRWLFLRALGVLFFSAFYSLARQIHGLIGERGILPARDYLDVVATSFGPIGRVWYAPTILWLSAGDRAMSALVAFGLAASVLLVLNVAPRAACLACTLAFLSFVAVGQDFADYQSDGMLLEAGILSTFLAPRGVRPRLGATQPPSRASVFLLLWEWFRIYFESGIVKIASGDRQWRTLTAMDHYYENGPLPTWIGYYVQHLPHAFHAATALWTLVLELAVVWLMFFGRRARIVLFCIVTPFQIGIILTANYAFLNYLVLALGVLLVDDAWLARLRLRVPPAPAPPDEAARRSRAARARVRRWGAAIALSWIFYATIAVELVPADVVLLAWPSLLLRPMRFANAYGLFAVMTDARFEIELQGTRDGVTWTPYPFRYKPQDPYAAPGIYAPYQPRFEWNLWFASLGEPRGNEWVLEAEERLVEGSPAVLALFARDPFDGGAAGPVRAVRAVRWRYWFTDLETKRRTGRWWNRELVGPYGPVIERRDDGTIGIAPATVERTSEPPARGAAAAEHEEHEEEDEEREGDGGAGDRDAGD